MPSRLLRPIAAPLLLLVLGPILLTGCANYFRPFNTDSARPGFTESTRNEFKNLPGPESKVVVGVYRFRDQTGQYENTSQGGISYSTAVTQGGSAILVSALERSGWFNVVERRGLSNLVNERKIVNQMRSQYQGGGDQNLQQLPPLLYAGVLLEGGIIGYDSNVITGGSGARYFGLGASGKFRQDQVTVHLRAVSTQNGEVLESVRTTKTIMSQQVNANLFRFVEPSRLLEAETGYTFNEPRVIAVTEAINEAVKNLVIEGVRGGLWSLDNPQADTSQVFQNYDRQKELSARRSSYGQLQHPKNRPGFGLGGTIGGQRIEGNASGALIRPSFRVHARRFLGEGIGMGAEVTGSQIAVESAVERNYLAANLHALYYMLPNHRISPYLQAGGGGLLLGNGNREQEVVPYVTGTAGIELMATNRIAISVGVSNEYPLRTDLDGSPGGHWNDNLWHVQTGVTLYPF